MFDLIGLRVQAKFEKEVVQLQNGNSFEKIKVSEIKPAPVGEIKPETQIQPGQILGWVEGFKAISDVYSFSEGQFVGTNPALQQNITLINKKPYREGWIYEVKGQLDNKCIDAEGYAAILNQTIDKMLEQQQAEKNEEIE